MTEQQILFKLTALCAGSEHCSYEMTEKMRKWDVDDETQARVMAYLTRERYVDDERYCRFFVRDKIRFNKWGRRKVEQALMVKRIPSEVYKPVLDEVDGEDFTAILRPLLNSKRKTLKAATTYELNTKLMKFALSRGFDMETIRKCLTDVDELFDD